MDIRIGVLVGVLVLTASSFTFAKIRKRETSEGSAVDAVAGNDKVLYSSEPNYQLPNGARILKNQRLYSNQDFGTPMVDVPSQTAEVLARPFRGDFCGIWTGQTAVDKTHFEAGMRFLEVQYSTRKFWVSVFHVMP